MLQLSNKLFWFITEDGVPTSLEVKDMGDFEWRAIEEAYKKKGYRDMITVNEL